MWHQWEDEFLFWRRAESIVMDGHGYGYGYGFRPGWSWSWSCSFSWTLAVVLFIFTCRALRFRFQRPSSSSAAAAAASALKTAALPSTRATTASPVISDLDLKNLIDNLDGDGDGDDGNIWENAVEKRRNSVSYKAKSCKPKDGPIKYLSVTTFEDCSAELLLNFYMDNLYRMEWDKTVVSHQQLQLDHDSGVEIGRTIKKFPFLNPREYVLAWKLWQGQDGSFYCISKECEHPLAPKGARCIRVSVFRSGWRIRKVLGRNATEIRIVHQEDAGLNVEMAKLAFTKGIWSYVCKMDDALRKYSAREQHLPYSNAGVIISIQKVPHKFEVTNDESCTLHPENLIKTTTHEDAGICKPNARRLHIRRPSNKFIANGLILLGGAICLSRGHSNLGAKVATAYVLSKLTKRETSPSTGKLSQRA